jgi:PPOX class probable F420-dependent enzyme
MELEEEGMSQRTRSDEQERFLREPNIAILATVDARGQPHAVPIWYLYEDGVFVMNVARGSQKHLNVERHPRTTLVMDRRSLPYYAVMVQGLAEIGPPMDAEARLRIAIHYLGEDRGRAYSARRAGDGEETVTIRLRPEKIIEYHGVAGREE